MSRQPVVLVGMPRSGSTLLTRLLNESPDLFVVNDFYFLQTVDAETAFDTPLTRPLATKFAKDLVKRIYARVERPESPPIECGLKLTTQQEDALLSFALEQAATDNQTWSTLLNSIMVETGRLLGKSRWGYNTPQDHIHLDRLFKTFPDVKVIFLLRDPRDILRSYKYVASNGYHNPRRYHPAAQAFIWRTAVQHFLKEEKQQRNVFMIRYEEVVNDTQSALQKIASFTGISIPSVDLSTFGNNSSFTQKNKNKQLCESEVCICEKVAAKEIEAVGYERSKSNIQIKDIGYLAFISLRFVWFYSMKSILSKDVRTRLLRGAASILKTAN